jgi:LmbE family N-acetylglucosaminyl deacetylase
MIPKDPKILCIGAHPDDIELGCAGLLQREFMKNDKLFVVCTAGHTGGYGLDRVVEADAAAGKLNADVRFLDLTDGELYKELFTLVSVLTDIVVEYAPDIIFTHVGDDHHQDHRTVFNATMSAVRSHDGLVLGYHSWSWMSQTYDLEVDVCQKKKREVLDVFVSQWQRPYMQAHASELFTVLKWKI